MVVARKRHELPLPNVSPNEADLQAMIADVQAMAQEIDGGPAKTPWCAYNFHQRSASSRVIRPCILVGLNQPFGLLRSQIARRLVVIFNNLNVDVSGHVVDLFAVLLKVFVQRFADLLRFLLHFGMETNIFILCFCELVQEVAHRRHQISQRHGICSFCLLSGSKRQLFQCQAGVLEWLVNNSMASS